MSCALGGCSFLQKDNTRPVDRVREDVIAAFAKQNINLHIFIDEPVPMIRQVIFPFGGVTRGPSASDDFLDIKDGSNDQGKTGIPCGSRDIDGHFGSLSDRSDPNCVALLKARRMVVRYGIFGDQIKDHLDNSGIAWGDDFLVTLGEWTFFGKDEQQVGKINKWGGLRVAQASTLMHELGHTLGLKHGGNEGINNCKPNYLSIMNYTLQFPVADPNRPMDYSDKELDLLNEKALTETLGISGPANRRIVYGAGFDGSVQLKPANQPLDWNGNGPIDDAPVEADINYINIDGCRDKKSPGDLLTGHDDWKSICFSLIANKLSLIANNRTCVRQVGFGQTELVYDISESAVIELAKAVDADNDGLSNYDDNCPGIYNPTQEDSNKDGFGDICTQRYVFLPVIKR
jgi:hypothetical protein